MDGNELNKIIRNCQKGEKRSQKRLYDLYSSKMMTVCLRYTRNRKDAEDVLQEGFIKVYTKIGQFAFRGSFEGWVRRVFVHTALRFLDNRKWVVELNDNIIAVNSSIDVLDDEDDKTKQILTLISTLPIGYQMVFNLFVMDGYDHSEISDILGITKSTSRSQLVKARKKLQKMIIEQKLL